MISYSIIKEQELQALSKEELAARYNDAVETIWYLQYSLKKMSEDYDLMAEAYEEVSTKLYG